MSPELDHDGKWTPSNLTAAVRRVLQQRVDDCVAVGRRAVERRLDELEREWDADRAMTAAAGGATLAGLLMTRLTGHRRWLLLPPVAAGLLLQQAIQGRSPATRLLRQLGVRCKSEIHFERDLLLAAIGESELYSKDDWVETASGHIKRASEA